MDISVVVATYNRGNSLVNTLDGLREQTYPTSEYEVILADDGSTDNTPEVVADYLARHSLTTWRYMRHDKNVGKPAVVNAAIREASSPLIAFTDDDIVPCREWLAAHVACHRREPGPAVVVGTVSYPDDWTAKSNLVRFHNSRYSGRNKHTACATKGGPLRTPHFGGGNSSVPKAILMEVGLFDETMRRGQDSEMGLRLWERGLRFVFEPAAAVLHYAQAVWSYKKWLAAFQKFYVDCALEAIRRHPETYYQFSHWFVEPPKPFHEPFKRTLVKLFYRAGARPRLGRLLARFMESHDADPRFYFPVVFKYIMLCAAIEGVKLRQRKQSVES